MADKFFNSNGIEIGYIAKRKQQMREEFGKGLNLGLGKSTKVQYEIKPKKKHDTSKKKEAPPAPKQPTGDIYTKKDLDNGKTMYFKNNLIVSKDEYEKNAKDK